MLDLNPQQTWRLQWVFSAWWEVGQMGKYNPLACTSVEADDLFISSLHVIGETGFLNYNQIISHKGWLVSPTGQLQSFGRFHFSLRHVVRSLEQSWPRVSFLFFFYFFSVFFLPSIFLFYFVWNKQWFGSFPICDFDSITPGCIRI